MRVLFINRATLYTNRGGDTVQMENTACALRQLGVKVDIELCNNPAIDYSKYDLIHFFNIIRPANIIHHIDKAGKPFVISPVYLMYHDLLKNGRDAKSRMLSLFGRDEQEYLKCLARSLFNHEKIVSRKYLSLGHKRSIQYILDKCSHLLPNSHSELCRLKSDFNYTGPYAVIPNAVDNTLFFERPHTPREQNSVLCVARIEPHKNQLNLIKALKDTRYKLTIAGTPSHNHRSYFKACKKAGSGQVTFINRPSSETIADLYNHHITHVLPSWFETTGLSSLEAAACGCNIVVSARGDTPAYFSGSGFFCEPDDINSIRDAIDKAMTAPQDKAFMHKVIHEYNWNVTAEKTLKAYEHVLLKY